MLIEKKDNEIEESEKIDNEIKFLKRNLEISYLELAKRLHEVEWNKLYLNLNYSNFFEYTLSTKIPWTTVERLIRIYRELVLKHKIESEKIIIAGGWSKVFSSLPIIVKKTKKEEVEEVLEKVSNMTTYEINVMLRKNKTKNKEKCGCKKTFKIEYEICKECGEIVNRKKFT